MTDWRPLPIPERTARLEYQLTTMGGQVISQGSTQASVKYGQPINNTLHAILSIFTCGAWLIVWAIIGVTSKPQTIVQVWVDEYGRVSTKNGPGNEWVERMPATPRAAD